MADTYFIRQAKERNYTVMDNTFLRDKTLSWKAKGLFAYLLSLPEDWKIYINDLVNRSADGETALRSAINELIKKGYISREQLKNEQGKFANVVYKIIENPLAENPNAEKPNADNQALLNTNTTNNLNINNLNIPSKDFDNSQNDSGQKKEPNKYEKIVNLYNDTCNELPKLIKLTEKRKTAINKLLKEYTVEEIENGFKLFNESDFCKGINDRGWKADFDFCIKPDKMASVLEGKYKNNVKQAAPVKQQTTKANKFHNFIQHEEQDLEAIARKKFEKKMNELRGK